MNAILGVTSLIAFLIAVAFFWGFFTEMGKYVYRRFFTKKPDNSFTYEI